MSHSTIIISSTVVPAAPGAEDHHPEVEASITYRPSDSATPQQVGQTVTRIMKRLPAIADGPDE